MDGGRYGGDDRRGGRLGDGGREDQAIDGTERPGGLEGHHRVDMARVPVEKRRMMHRRLVERAGRGILMGASLVDAYRLSEARRCRRGRWHSLGSVPSTSLIDTHGDGKAGRGGLR